MRQGEFHDALRALVALQVRYEAWTPSYNVDRTIGLTARRIAVQRDRPRTLKLQKAISINVANVCVWQLFAEKAAVGRAKRQNHVEAFSRLIRLNLEIRCRRPWRVGV